MSQLSQQQQKIVLITGCSDGGLGAALALAYHEAGYRMSCQADSITAYVSSVSRLTGDPLNIVVNNAGAQYNMPISDLSIPEAKKIFDLNVWGYIPTIQAFIPLRMKAKGGAMIVNHTSVGSIAGLPFQAAYNASKAAFAMFSDILRLELQAFAIKVVDLKTGGVKSTILTNLVQSTYVDADVWAKSVVRDLTRSNPPYQIWCGGSVWLARLGTLLPVGMFDGELKKVTGLDEVIRKLKEGE